MQKNFAQTNEEISSYVAEICKPEDHILAEVRKRSAQHNLPPIQVNDMDGLHLEMLIRMSKSKKVVEIGTLAGYSGISIARGIQKDGVLHTFELEEKHAAQAAESFQKADVSHLIKQYVGPALENLKTIEKEGPFDAVFIDADKVSYPDYLTWAEKNLKIGGLIIGDNTFAWGNIHNTNIQDKELAQKVNALRDFNARIMRNPKFRATILPTGEGLTVGIKIA